MFGTKETVFRNCILNHPGRATDPSTVNYFSRITLLISFVPIMSSEKVRKMRYIRRKLRKKKEDAFRVASLKVKIMNLLNLDYFMAIFKDFLKYCPNIIVKIMGTRNCN